MDEIFPNTALVGRFSVIITRSDLPKFAASNHEPGSPEENKAIV